MELGSGHTRALWRRLSSSPSDSLISPMVGSSALSHIIVNMMEQDLRRTRAVLSVLRKLEPRVEVGSEALSEAVRKMQLTANAKDVGRVTSSATCEIY